LVLLSTRTGGENNIELRPSRARWQQIAVPSEALKREFVEKARWPIDRPSLPVLPHMGRTIEQIARYFSVEPAEAQALLNNGK
jgi:hypothetical protein